MRTRPLLLAAVALALLAAACGGAPAGTPVPGAAAPPTREAASPAPPTLPSPTAPPARSDAPTPGNVAQPQSTLPPAPALPPTEAPAAEVSQELHATDPGTVNLAAGRPQLVEFFAFW